MIARILVRSAIRLADGRIFWSVRFFSPKTPSFSKLNPLQPTSLLDKERVSKDGACSMNVWYGGVRMNDWFGWHGIVGANGNVSLIATLYH